MMCGVASIRGHEEVSLLAWLSETTNNHLNIVKRDRMFLAVLATALFMSSAATGGSTADSCTASLPPLVGGGGECSASGGGDLVNETNQNISALLEDVILCLLGHSPQYPANSCTEFAEQEPDIPSGNYWILNSTQSPAQVFCEMGEVFPASLNVTRGWVRVANLNMTDPDQQCPENLRLSYTNPIRLCGRKTDSSCDSVTFTTYGVQYRQVCGRVKGYQYGSPDAFDKCPSCTIDGAYVDGVSITHGASPRKHIWTYAAGLFANAIGSSCPCTGGGTPPPAFVGSDYYCESALSGPPWEPPVLHSNDTLWDGQDCDGLEHTCCDPPNLPWFCKELPEPTTDDLEFRLCGDEPHNTNEDIPIDLVELYIQ